MRLIISITFFLFCLPTFAQEYFTMEMAKDRQNKIVLTQSFKKLVIDPSAKIDNPIFLNEKRQILIRPLLEAVKPFDINVELPDGDTFTISVTPKLLDTPQVWRYKDAADIAEQVGWTVLEKDTWVARIFKDTHWFVYAQEKNPPRGMSVISNNTGYTLNVALKESELPLTIELKPISSFRGNGHTLRAYRVFADRSLNMENADFYTQDTVAVALETDYITPDRPPYVFILKRDQ